MEEAIEGLPDGDQQLLWEKFERVRKAASEQENKKYRDQPGGVGRVAKKKKFLVSWALDK